MVTFWYVIMLIILSTIVLLLPFAMFMYETDEEKTFVIKFTHSFISFLIFLHLNATLISKYYYC